ncbi:MAG: DinB family protein [Chitinophagaceae bacterium]|nr:DinB family protein [Chitinophagaceae bacterium]
MANTASIRTEGLLPLFDMHTTFFSRAIENLSKEDMQNRLNTKANHVAWLTGALIDQRFSMIQETNPELKQTAHELFENNKGIQDDAVYPTSDVYLKDWQRVSPLARKALAEIDDKKLDSEIDMGGMKMTYSELISFSLYREASMIGQIALWRRLLGHPALRYD